MLVHFGKASVLSAFMHKSYSRPERNEITELAHIYSITIRITDLWRGGNNDNFFRFKSGQHTYNAFPQGGSSYDGIVDHHQRINTFLHSTVRNIIYMLNHLITAGISCNEGAHLDVLGCNFFNPDFPVDHLRKFFFCQIITPGHDPFNHNLFKIIIQTLPHAVESNFSCIGYEGKYTVFQIVIY